MKAFQYGCMLALLVATGATIAEEAPGGEAPAAEAPVRSFPSLPADLVAALPGEELRWLDAGDSQFPALYLAENTGRPQGGVILLHGYWRHLDWPETIKPLRTALPDFGWHTLSLSLPPPPPGAKPPPRERAMPTKPATGAAGTAGGADEPESAPPAEAESAPDAEGGGADPAGESQSADAATAYREEIDARIGAGIVWLNKEGIFNIVVLGQESGGAWAARYFASVDRATSAGLVLIDAGERVAGVEKKLTEYLVTTSGDRRPVLDLHETGPGANRMAMERSNMVQRKQRGNFRQVKIMGRVTQAGDREGQLTRIVRGWLKKRVRHSLMRGG